MLLALCAPFQHHKDSILLCLQLQWSMCTPSGWCQWQMQQRDDVSDRCSKGMMSVTDAAWWWCQWQKQMASVTYATRGWYQQQMQQEDNVSDTCTKGMMLVTGATRGWCQWHTQHGDDVSDRWNEGMTQWHICSKTMMSVTDETREWQSDIYAAKQWCQWQMRQGNDTVTYMQQNNVSDRWNKGMTEWHICSKTMMSVTDAAGGCCWWQMQSCSKQMKLMTIAASGWC